jgi:hypothetical protein
LIVFLFKLKITIPYVHLGKQYVLYIKAFIFGLTPGGFIPKPFKLKKHLSTVLNFNNVASFPSLLL